MGLAATKAVKVTRGIVGKTRLPHARCYPSRQGKLASVQKIFAHSLYLYTSSNKGISLSISFLSNNKEARNEGRRKIERKEKEILTTYEQQPRERYEEKEKYIIDVRRRRR